VAFMTILSRVGEKAPHRGAWLHYVAARLIDKGAQIASSIRYHS
jgi:hypothetical protein